MSRGSNTDPGVRGLHWPLYALCWSKYMLLRGYHSALCTKGATEGLNSAQAVDGTHAFFMFIRKYKRNHLKVPAGGEKGSIPVFKVEWDQETGGVKLNSLHTSNTLGVSPRPVFFEELDMLKLNESGWVYPRCEEPLLWCCNKQYYYKGKFVFEVKGANVYDDPLVIFQDQCESLAIEPVNVELMLNRCKDQMFLVESEAIEFIRSTYEQYASAKISIEQLQVNQLDYEAMAAKYEKEMKQKMAIVKQDCDSFDIMPLATAKEAGKKTYQTTRIDKFLASFSGGKDSQVVLDLCTRAIPPSAFEVIYSDTGYELPTSLELYENVKSYYGKKFPQLKFSTARNHEKVINYWDKIGTPSDSHRWCCAVMKTAPLYRMLKVEGTNKQAKVLAFEGVRAEESIKRSEYERIGKGVKHPFVVNARPIFNWNTTEIFLYLFKYKLPINEAYKVGKPRVGCSFCPFSSPWDDMIVNKYYKETITPFLEKVISIAQQRKIPNLDEYIKERKWKLRASGNFMNEKSFVSFNKLTPIFEAVAVSPKQDIVTWFPTIGEYTLSSKDKLLSGEFMYKKTVYPFTIKINNDKQTLIVNNVFDSQLVKLLKRVMYKATYCIQCEGCEVECPTGALVVYPQIAIDKSKCIHCYKCLEFHNCGCIVADSLTTSNMNNTSVKNGISQYGTFAIHTEWIDEFFIDPEVFWNANSLGKKQIPSFKAWLRDAEIIDAKNKLTQLGEVLQNIRVDYEQVLWEIIWINIGYKTLLVNWFMNNVQCGQSFDTKMLSEMAQTEFGQFFAATSIQYAVTGFMQLFKYSPLGTELCQGVEKDKNTYNRMTYEDVSDVAVAYSIYKFGEYNKVKNLRVQDLFADDSKNGLFREFGLSKSTIEKQLRKLNSMNNRILVAELNMGLDHITLKDELNAITVLEQLTK